VKASAEIYWAVAGNVGALAPVAVQLPLSADAVQRCKQLLNALILSPPTPAQRTLPADTALLDFYLLADGTAIADFSDTLSTGTPSGILSEKLAVDSITQTLAASVPQVRRLKILLHGQQVDTLAGHIDLTGFFPVGIEMPLVPAAAPTTVAK
jgi:spore germination protein GerM